MDLKAQIRQIPDFPKPGILFYDISTLLQRADAFQVAIDRMADAGGAASTRPSGRHRIARLHLRRPAGAATRSRLRHGPQAGQAAGLGGRPCLQSRIRQRHHRDLGRPDPGRAAASCIVDDLIATGGTAAATAELLAKIDVEVVAARPS